ncbi:hypothetical protein [Stenotrophomonas maltophilia]|uniref:hypothetical protein n=1 Tax=Stenotrophomonas maltophilia TaxID=40324 RepID=UPI0012AF1C3F|nr:hypothetical protein [Stenotrophomonas maltophilia]MBA0250887.1 hypothetical protein [Stenotrophomonas maltophilia]MBA0319942.1 hypothetical protein [Stenotrophomonas maltophilia]QGL92543.1 hypothetical protein FEO92_09235 [Stenotrophomonas maltophilia]
MAQITAQQAGGVNVVAFLDMLAWSEGTDNGKQATKDRGYDVIVGGQLFNSFADHPRVLVDLPKLKIQSTAAGRYQLLHRYYDAYKKTLGLKDFAPLVATAYAKNEGGVPTVVQTLAGGLASPGEPLRGRPDSFASEDVLAAARLQANYLNEHMGRQVAGGRLLIGFLQQGQTVIKDLGAI